MAAQVPLEMLTDEYFYDSIERMQQRELQGRCDPVVLNHLRAVLACRGTVPTVTALLMPATAAVAA